MRRILLFSLAFLFCGLSSLGVWYVSYLRTPSPGEGEVVVSIARGMGVRQIGALLAQKKLIRDDIRYLGYVYLSDLTRSLKAGEYSVPRGLTPPQVLELLVEGTTLRHQVTIPEGLNMVQVAEVFSRDGWVDAERFLALSRNREFIFSLGLNVNTLEGYLFPETYTLVRNEVSEEQVLQMMTHRFLQVWKELKAPDQVHGLNRHQLVILASIVEKETGAAQERPLIARVFLNRLAKKMRLQSDPTVIYGIENFNGNITRADLKAKTPYNTYVIPGLPAGPICNPGRAALEAIIIPAESKALYFVSRNDGTHIFSTNLRDHNQAVWKFQKKK